MDCVENTRIVAERIAGSLVKYLHYLNVKIIAPSLDNEKKIAGARAVGADGYTLSELTDVYGEEVARVE